MTTFNSVSQMDRNLYNREIKLSFIENTYDSFESQITMFWQFAKAYEYENKIGKDISEMNKKELMQLIKGEIKPSTHNSAVNIISAYKRYIDYIGNNPNNPLSNIDTPKLASEVIAKEKNPRFSKSQVLNMIDKLNNDTDRALILCLFEGIKGRAYSEILTLRTKNLKQIGNDFYATVYNAETKENRTIQISEKLYDLILRADNQTHYRTNNIDSVVETPFLDTEYVFKKTMKGKQNELYLNHHFITRKFAFFKEFFGNEHLNADDFVRSGMMSMAHDLFMKSGKLGRDELLSIGEHYNTVMAYSGDSEHYRNITDIKRKVFNEHLEKLYPVLENIKYEEGRK